VFGTNPVSKARNEPGFLVKDVFYTVQGEGPFMGRPAVFVRLGGCNLRCYFCDTDFTHDTTVMSTEELCEAIETASDTCPLVVITGGEPMLQDLGLLFEHLAQDYPHISQIQIETAGTVWAHGIQKYIPSGGEHCWPEVTIVVSPKTPKVHIDIWAFAAHWKYIIKDGEYNPFDGLPNRSTQDRHNPLHTLIARPPRGATVYVQPMDEQDPIKNRNNQQAVATIAMEHGYRVSLQMHKTLGVE